MQRNTWILTVIIKLLLNYFNSISSIETIPSEDVILSYITNNFFKDIFFIQLAVIKEDELFDNSTIINPLKIFLKQAFILHLTHKVSCLTNLNMDNHYTLQQVKELDHLTNNLIILNSIQKMPPIKLIKLTDHVDRLLNT